MNFKHFNLRESRFNVFTQPEKQHRTLDRRRFLKNIGLSALAINPVVKSIDKVVGEPFHIISSADGFIVKRNARIAWQFPVSHFTRGAKVSVEKIRDVYFIKMNNLMLNGSNQSVDVTASIYENLFGWRMKMQIPQFGVDVQVNFLDWLDKQQLIEQRIHANLTLGNEETQSNIRIEGEVDFAMDTRWNMYFEGDKAVALRYAGKTYQTSALAITGRGQTFKSFITAPAGSLNVKLPGFAAWSRFMSDIRFAGDYSMHYSGANPDLNFLMWNDKSGIHHQSLWVNHSGDILSFRHKFQKGHDFKFNKLFFFSENNENLQPEVYLAALSAPGQWINNKIGSFQIGSDNSLPDFEAVGYASDIRSYRYAPRLTAFKPLIVNALTLPDVLEKPVNIVLARCNDESMPLPEEVNAITTNAQDTAVRRTNLLRINKTTANPSTQTQTQKSNQSQPVIQKTSTPEKRTGILKVIQPDDKKKEQTEQPKVQTPGGDRTAKPEKQDPVVTDKRKTVNAKLPEISTVGKDIQLTLNDLKFRILRPEDLLLLEFEFRNFILATAGNKNTLSLQKKGTKGLVIIRIQTQHTLEEAFFEENKIPDPDKKAPDVVSLPVRHLRAYRSRLVFEYPAGSESFALNINELLDWSKFELRVDPRAWVRVPLKLDRESIIKNPKYSRVSVVGKNKTVAVNQKQDLAYGLKLNQTNVMRADRIKQYDAATVNNVFSASVSDSLLSNSLQQAQKAMLKPGPVPEDSTCIEAPALMYISPNQTGGFEHRIVLKKLSQGDSAEIYELWHTKLGVRLKDGKVTDAMPYLRTIRALWAFDAGLDYKSVPNVNNPLPFRASLDASDRHILVHTTSNYTDIPGYQPATVPVNKLMLTPLGAYLDWHAFFDVPTTADTYLDIIEWEHFATLGRDHFVKIVKEGYLFPFGHRAALVKITERKFMKENRSAVNRQRMYIVVLQKEVVYDRTIPQGDFLKFPFQAVEIINSNTPDIDNPQTTTIDAGLGGYNFYIHSLGKPFQFDVIFTDKEGAEHRKKIPLAFVGKIVARDTNKITPVVNDYLDKTIYNNLFFSGDNISYAESLIEGDTGYETREIKFGAVTFPSPGEGEICFRPTIQHALVKLEAVNQLTGNNDPAKIMLVDDSNPGHVFASVENAVLDFSGGSDKAGGFLTPNMAITGLSRLHGTVGGAIDDAMNMAFNAAKVFETLDKIMSAKIFGVIDIFSLFDLDSSNLAGSMDDFINQIKAIQQKIEQFRNAIKLAEAKALELEKAAVNNINYTQSQLQSEINKIRQELEAELATVKNNILGEVTKLRNLMNSSVPRIPNLKTYMTDDAFHVQYKWQPDLGKSEKEIFPDILTVKITDPKKALQIDTHFEKPFELSAAPKLTSVARFDNFRIEVADCIAVIFKSLRFETGTSGKSGVKVDMGDVPMEFTGALDFINSLNSIIPSSGFSDDGNGPYLDLTASGIKAGYTLALPNFELGICMITNISLGAYINLPFTGDPLTIGFFFCTRENPFMLTISCFGGGGFIQLITRLDGLESIEAAFEFGAAISLNVGVASGSVSVMGGIYYKSKNVQITLPDSRVITQNQADLSAYLRINGKLSILGLIHVSLEFYLELHAVIAGGKVQKLEGSATLKVKVSVLFFSKTVSVTVRRTLAGSGGDPKFAEMIFEEDWEQYCLAFSD
ncbi:MAG: hypothetical protein QMB37_09630 [Paludibacteraceae bacterium]